MYESTPFQLDPEVAKKQISRLNRIKSGRDREAVLRSLDDLRLGAKEDKNLMPYLISAVKHYCSVGEISEVLRQVYGVYQEKGIL